MKPGVQLRQAASISFQEISMKLLLSISTVERYINFFFFKQQSISQTQRRRKFHTKINKKLWSPETLLPLPPQGVGEQSEEHPSVLEFKEFKLGAACRQD